MKALIFNSGIGKRMGEMTKNSPKSMLKLLNGETIFERQIRLLSECGIREFVITTGPFEEQLMKITQKPIYSNLKFTFVHNDLYDKTNYIYSCYLARNYLDDELLTLHGDLVFDKKLVLFMLRHPYASIGLINPSCPLPEKDFKARVSDGKIVEVGIDLFDKNCFTFQPFYKLSKKDAKVWLDAIIDFIENRKISGVYAENAFNTISNHMDVKAVSYEEFYINEIDNLEDYSKVSKDIQVKDYQNQEIVYSIDSLESILERFTIKKPLVIIDSFLKEDENIKRYFQSVQPVFFDGFKPNPNYNEIVQAVKLFRERQCDGIVALGGGSAIDVAKAVKLFVPLSDAINYLEQDSVYVNLKLIAIPTTAGTGSESTKYSVIYYQGEKQSLTQDCLIPDIAILDVRFLKTLPLSQKKATAFDSLCHAIESIWSINATKDSIAYASEAIKLILNHITQYFNNDEPVFKDMIIASNLAGKAINISQTTAAHAMSYKITSLYRVPHGQAVANCLPGVWGYLLEHKQNEVVNYSPDLSHRLQLLDELFCGNALSIYTSLLKKCNMFLDCNLDVEILSNSVNAVRLKNFPLTISKEGIEKIYNDINEQY